jgi:hypothetical protein
LSAEVDTFAKSDLSAETLKTTQLDSWHTFDPLTASAHNFTIKEFGSGLCDWQSEMPIFLGPSPRRKIVVLSKTLKSTTLLPLHTDLRPCNCTAQLKKVRHVISTSTTPRRDCGLCSKQVQCTCAKIQATHPGRRSQGMVSSRRHRVE